MSRCLWSAVSCLVFALGCDPTKPGVDDAGADDAGADANDCATGDCADAGIDAGEECTVPPCEEEVASFPLESTHDLDVLFLVDNSGSMAAEQASLANNFHRFINVLENRPGGLPNLHLGVVSSNLGAGSFSISGCDGNGDNGKLQSDPNGACSGPSGAFISDISDGDGGRIKNYSGSLSDTFACIAMLGNDGCGFEQQLEAVRRALNGSNPENAGFLREDAYLAVVLLTDEDDCSTADTNMFDTSQNDIDDPLGPLSSLRCFEFGVVCNPDSPRVVGAKSDCQPRADSPYMYDITEHATFLKGLKEDPNKVVVAGIIGNPTPVTVGTNEYDGNPDLQPSCASAQGEADPGVRLAAFLREFPERHTITTICNEDLSDALTLIAELVGKLMHGSCLEGNLHDADPVAPGLQPECEIVETVGGDETVLPVCNNATDPQASSNLPCHLILEQPLCSESETGLEVRVYRELSAPTAGVTITARCLVD